MKLIGKILIALASIVLAITFVWLIATYTEATYILIILLALFWILGKIDKHLYRKVGF